MTFIFCSSEWRAYEVSRDGEQRAFPKCSGNLVLRFKRRESLSIGELNDEA
jgi:hypothetical protein